MLPWAYMCRLSWWVVVSCFKNLLHLTYSISFALFFVIIYNIAHLRTISITLSVYHSSINIACRRYSLTWWRDAILCGFQPILRPIPKSHILSSPWGSVCHIVHLRNSTFWNNRTLYVCSAFSLVFVTCTIPSSEITRRFMFVSPHFTWTSPEHSVS